MPNHEQIDAITIDQIRSTVNNVLHNPRDIEVTISGDLSLYDMEKYAVKYLGTVQPEVQTQAGTKHAPLTITKSKLSDMVLSMTPLGPKEQLAVHLPDSNVRAMGYIAGPAPNHWGVCSNKETLQDRLSALMIKNDKVLTEEVQKRRQHPLFTRLSLILLQEVR